MGCPKLTYNLTTEPRLRCVYSAAEEEEGRVASRTGMIDQTTETFKYDDLDRLTHVKHNNIDAMEMEYQSNGNIFTKTGLGEYAYHPTQVHAVEYIDNTDDLRNPRRQEIEYNAFNKATLLIDTVGNDAYQLKIFYGPDQQRWKTVLKKNGVEIKRILYVGDYEVVTENGGAPQEMIYLTGGSLHVTQNSQSAIYYTHKDHLGSIISITDNAGNYVFKASYDAWGLQTIDPNYNTFKFHRGYTGHEHLPEFGLINMNGRMYDPIVGRFLSPDPYVQAPDFSQGYNRYSYCINNPLIYTDPSGEIFGWIGNFFRGSVNSARGSIGFAGTGAAASSPIKNTLLEKALVGIGLDALTGGIFGATVLTKMSIAFSSGLVSDFKHEGWGSFSDEDGKLPWDEAWQRARNAWRISMGLFKADEDKSEFNQFLQVMSRWTIQQPMTMLGYEMSNVLNNWTHLDGVEYFHGATVLLSSLPDHSHSEAISIGGYIVMNPRSGGLNYDNDVLLHEYGHFLQTRQWGGFPATFSSSLFSLVSAGTGLANTRHNNIWAERDANARALSYFRGKMTEPQIRAFTTANPRGRYFDGRFTRNFLVPFHWIFFDLIW